MEDKVDAKKETDEIDANKSNPTFLEEAISSFIQTGGEGKAKLTDSQIGRAIKFLPERASGYFEEVYTGLVRLLANDTSYGGFRVVKDNALDYTESGTACGNNYNSRYDAIMRITNQDFLRRVVEEVPDNCCFGYDTPQAHAAGQISDQVFLREIITKKSDMFIVTSAISNSTDVELLRELANITDEKCKQRGTSGRDAFYTEPWNNQQKRNAARKRIGELAPKILGENRITKDRAGNYRTLPQVKGIPGVFVSHAAVDNILYMGYVAAQHKSV